MADCGHRRGLYIAVLLVALCGCAAPTSPEGTEVQSPDSVITSRVRNALSANPRVRAALIEVNTANGVVRLSGFADSRLEADDAVSIANDVPGVKRVQNDIVIRVSRDRRP
jgi:osmotically-inducible protein OsmY